MELPMHMHMGVPKAYMNIFYSIATPLIIIRGSLGQFLFKFSVWNRYSWCINKYAKVEETNIGVHNHSSYYPNIISQQIKCLEEIFFLKKSDHNIHRQNLGQTEEIFRNL